MSELDPDDLASGGAAAGVPIVGTDTRVAARGSIASALVQIAGRAFSMGFVLAASRILLPDEFSRYSVVAAVILVGLLLADFGTTSVIVRQVSRTPTGADAIVAKALPASAGLGIAAYGGVAGFAWALYPPELALDVSIGALAVPFGSISSSLLAAMDGVGRIGRHAAITLLQTVVTAGFGVTALAFDFGARGVAWALAAGAGVALACGLISVRRHGIWSGMLIVRKKELWDFLVAALPFAALGLISAVSLRFDVLMLSLLSTARQTAIYDVALRGIEAILSLNVIAAGPGVYLFSSRIGRGDLVGTQRAFDGAIRIAYLTGLPLSAIVVVLHDPLAQGIFGDAFAGAGLPLAILGAHVWLVFVAYVQGSLIVAGDFQRRGVVVAASITAVVVVLDLALIPPFGARGAAAAGLVTAVVTVVGFGRFHRTHTGIKTMAPPPGILLATLTTGVTAWLLRAQVLPAVLLVSGAVYAAALVLTRSVTASDTARLRSIIGRPSAG